MANKKNSKKSEPVKSLAAGLKSGLGTQIKNAARMVVSSLTGNRKHKLDDLRADLQPLVDRANEAISKLTEEGTLESSEAYQNYSH